MKLLYDQNLSKRLVRQLSAFFPDSQHVFEVGLATSDDREIWDYAKKNELTIVSKDSDFYALSQMFGFPPKVVWLQCGNVHADFIETIININREVIKEFINNKESGLLILR